MLIFAVLNEYESSRLFRLQENESWQSVEFLVILQRFSETTWPDEGKGA